MSGRKRPAHDDNDGDDDCERESKSFGGTHKDDRESWLSSDRPYNRVAAWRAEMYGHIIVQPSEDTYGRGTVLTRTPTGPQSLCHTCFEVIGETPSALTDAAIAAMPQSRLREFWEHAEFGSALDELVFYLRYCGRHGCRIATYYAGVYQLEAGPQDAYVWDPLGGLPFMRSALTRLLLAQSETAIVDKLTAFPESAIDICLPAKSLYLLDLIADLRLQYCLAFPKGSGYAEVLPLVRRIANTEVDSGLVELSIDPAPGELLKVLCLLLACPRLKLVSVPAKTMHRFLCICSAAQEWAPRDDAEELKLTHRWFLFQVPWTTKYVFGNAHTGGERASSDPEPCYSPAIDFRKARPWLEAHVAEQASARATNSAAKPGSRAHATKQPAKRQQLAAAEASAFGS